MQISQDAIQDTEAGSDGEKTSWLKLSGRAEKKTDWLYLSFVIGCALLPLLARLYLLLQPEPLNPDEAQWTVSARQIFDDIILWRRNDLMTSGPLNAVVVAWPNLFGLLPSIATSRLTGLLLQSGAMLGLALLIRPNALFSAGTAATLMSVAFLSTNIDRDFNHYSSEDLSIVLIAGFCMLFATAKPGDASALRWLGCGLLATSLVFAKLQSSLFSGLFHACCLLRFGIEAHRGTFSWRAFFAYAFGALLPVLVLVAPLFFVGEQDAFITGYLGLGANYKGVRTLNSFDHGGFVCLAIVSGFGLFYVLARLLEPSRRWQALQRIDLLILALGLWPVTLLTIWLPGQNFHHYLLYAFVALPLSCILPERALPASRENPARRRYLAGAFFLLLAGYIIHRLPNMTSSIGAAAEELAFARDGESRSLFTWAGIGPGDRAIMWGWEPWLLAFAEVKSADRTTHAEYLIRPNHGRDYFRARLLRDLEGKDPALTIDTMRDGSWFPDERMPPMQSPLRSFPALFERVAASSVEMTRRPECAAVYLRRDKAELLKRTEVSLQSSVPALVDGSITERCEDWWAPGAPGAVATLRPAAPAKLDTVWLLGSIGGRKTFENLEKRLGTPHVRIRFRAADGRRQEQIVHLFDYPLWTVVQAPRDQEIAEIDVELLDQVGAGPALNEVKAFRASPKSR